MTDFCASSSGYHWKPCSRVPWTRCTRPISPFSSCSGVLSMTFIAEPGSRLLGLPSCPLEQRNALQLVVLCLRQCCDHLLAVLLHHLHRLADVEGACEELLALARHDQLAVLEALEQCLPVKQDAVRVGGPTALVAAYHVDLAVLVADRFDHKIGLLHEPSAAILAHYDSSQNDILIAVSIAVRGRMRRHCLLFAPRRFGDHLSALFAKCADFCRFLWPCTRKSDILSPHKIALRP